MFVLACFVLNFLKNCVVHSSSLSYLLCASFGPAGLILAASALISAFSFCIFVILSIDGGSLLFCIFLSEFSSSPSLMYSFDFSFAFLCFLFLLLGIHMRVLCTFPIWIFLYLCHNFWSLFFVSLEFSEFLSWFLVRIVYRYLFCFLMWLFCSLVPLIVLPPLSLGCGLNLFFLRAHCPVRASARLFDYFGPVRIFCVLSSLVLTVADSLVYALSVFPCIFLNTSLSCFLLIIIVTNPPWCFWYDPSSFCVYRKLCFPHSYS